MARASSGPASASVGLGTRPRGGEPSRYAASVIEVVARIPRGWVMTYGDVAEYLGSGAARAVGNVMYLHGHDLSWWRVLLSTGHPSPSNPVEALERLRAEGVPLLPGGERVDLPAARWDGHRKARRLPR